MNTSKRAVLQDWVCELPFMQQSVLIAAMRGPDGVEKTHKSKNLLKWYRRCVVISAFDGFAINNPYHRGGGSYTGPSIAVVPFDPNSKNEDWEPLMEPVVKDFLDSQDNLPHHFYLHAVHAFAIVGYKHSDGRVRAWWNKVYNRLCHDMHMQPETLEQLNYRLDDNEEKWRKDSSRFKSH